MKGRRDWSEVNQQDQDDLELLVLDRIGTLAAMRESAERWENLLTRLFGARVRDAAPPAYPELFAEATFLPPTERSPGLIPGPTEPSGRPSGLERAPDGKTMRGPAAGQIGGGQR